MVSLVVPAWFPILQRSLDDLVINKCVNIEILDDESMKHGLNDIKRQFMSCLIPVHCTCNILIIFKTAIQLVLFRRAKSNVIKIRFFQIPGKFCCTAIFVPNITTDFNQ